MEVRMQNSGACVCVCGNSLFYTLVHVGHTLCFCSAYHTLSCLCPNRVFKPACVHTGVNVPFRGAWAWTPAM